MNCEARRALVLERRGLFSHAACASVSSVRKIARVSPNGRGLESWCFCPSLVISALRLRFCRFEVVFASGVQVSAQLRPFARGHPFSQQHAAEAPHSRRPCPEAATVRGLGSHLSPTGLCLSFAGVTLLCSLHLSSAF